MKVFTRTFLLIFSLLAGFSVKAQLTGTITVPSGTYPTLASVVTALNTQGVGTGGVTVNITASNPQTAPAGGYLLGSATLNASTSATKTITINGNNNTVTAPVGTTTSMDGIFVILGTDYVTINGLNLAESAANTTGTTAMEYGYAFFNLNNTAPFDGCQNNTIQNCTVTMNRTVATPSKAVFVAHQVYNSTSALSPTAATDLHSNNKFYGNTFTNCITGVYLGGATSANDVGNDIGGTSAATGNTMNNVVGALYSSVGAVTCTYQTNCNISYNTINNTANGGTNAIATAWGIYAYGPSCTFTVNNNTISLTEAAISTAYAAYGIYGNASAANITASGNTVTVSEPSGSAVNNIAIFLPNGNNTTITNNIVTQSMALSGTTYGIYITSTGAGVINGNTVKQTTSAATSSQFYSIVSGGTGTSESIQNNVFDNPNISAAGTLGYMALIYTANGTGNKIISGNIIQGMATHNSSADFYGVVDNPASAPGAGTAVISGNNFSNVTKSGTGGMYMVYEAPTVASTRNLRISGNTFSALTHNGTGPLVALYYASGNNDSIFSNQFYNITGAGSVFGIYGTSPAAVNARVYKNKLYTISSTGTTAGGVFGITNADGTTTSIYNNYIGDLQASAISNTTDAVRGINLLNTTASSTVNLYYNTIYLNASSSGANFSTAGVFHTASATATTAALDMRNNIIVNTSAAAGTGNTAAFRRSGTALNNYSATSNNNLFYAGTPGTTKLIMNDGTNSYQTLATYQAAVSTRDAASITENPNFLSTTGAAANYLHIGVSTATAIESGGTAIAGYTDDYDGDVRQGNTGYAGGGTAPDIGADEFNLCNTVTYTTQAPATIALCAGNNTSLTIAATNAVTYQWQVNTGSGFTDITNGGVYSGATTATLTITGATTAMSGYMYKCLARYSSACPQISSNTTTLTVNPLPVVTVTPSGSTSFCTGSSVTLSVPTGTNLTYQWSNGSAISGATNNAYTTSTTGSYTVTVTNTATSCTATSAATPVTVGIGPAAAITPSGTVAICPGSSTTLSAGTASGVTYQWNQGGTPIGGATNNTYSANAAGNYTVTVYSSPTCFTNSSATAVTISPLPTATASAANGGFVCQGSTIVLSANTGTGLTYQWTQGGTNITGATSATYSAGNAGTYAVKVTSTATGCTNTSANVSVTVNPLPAASITANGSLVICSGSSVMFTANNGVGLSYQWKQGTNPISGANNINYTTGQAGSYSVTVTDGNGCSNTSAAQTLTVNPTPVATISYTTPLVFCEGGAVLLTTASASNLAYQWLLNGQPLPNAVNSSNISYQTGAYTVKVTTNLNCSATSQPVNVTVNALPHPAITRNNMTLSTAAGFTSYQWYYNGQAIGGATGASTFISQNGAYQVSVTDANGCTNMSTVMYVNNVGIGTVTVQAGDVKVYPNPAHRIVYIDAPVTVNVTVRDLTGKVIYAREAVKEIDLGNIADGVYMILVSDQQGRLIKAEKLFKAE